MVQGCAVIRAGGLRPQAQPSHGRTLQEQERMLRGRQLGEVQAGSICSDMPCHFLSAHVCPTPSDGGGHVLRAKEWKCFQLFGLFFRSLLDNWSRN